MMKMEVTNISTFAKATIPHSVTKEKGENISWKFYKKIQSSKERRISLMYKKNSKQGQEIKKEYYKKY